MIEIIFFNLWVILKKTNVLSDDFLIPQKKKGKKKERSYQISEPIIVDEKRKQSIRREILHELGKTSYCYFEKVVNLFSETTLIFSTTTRFNISNQRDDFYNAIINLKRVNDIRRINKFFEAVNEKLPKGGIFVCFAETTELRKKRILSKYPPVINNIYYILDYLLKRVFPKFPITKNIYFTLTRGENRVISKAELLGRLYSCGFEVVEEEYVDNNFYVVAHKIKHPAFDLEPTYGPLIKLKRIGLGGKIIKVYKLRTMHPYAEYLQSYIFDKYNLQEGGKFKNDFRVSTLGRFMRRFWIDELPMLVNLFRGDLKIVGVRPLSQHYFNLYSKELQEKRIKTKPGLIPPFYVDNPKTLEEIMASEMKYLDAYEKHPYRTDIKYFFKAIYNIIFKRFRSN
jgi:lipopolysaccharide/colanic/teichoic acid biosynthesis glycosyltransferase